jgi:hypothetical protein
VTLIGPETSLKVLSIPANETRRADEGRRT